MAILSKEQLAERGALSAILDLRAEIEAIQAAYPSVVQAERVAKMKATVAAKGPSGVKPGPKPKAAKDPNAPKKSHKKKAPATLGQAVSEAAKAQADGGQTDGGQAEAPAGDGAQAADTTAPEGAAAQG